MTKHEAMIQFIEQGIQEIMGGNPFFNFAKESPGAVSFLTNYSGKIVKRYVRAADKEYGFTILLTWHYSPDSDNTNVEAMNAAQNLMDWIDGQKRLGNVPDFGKCQIKKVETLQNMPNLANVDLEENLAQYMIQCRVLYFEKER